MKYSKRNLNKYKEFRIYGKTPELNSLLNEYSDLLVTKTDMNDYYIITFKYDSKSEMEVVFSFEQELKEIGFSEE